MIRNSDGGCMTVDDGMKDLKLYNLLISNENDGVTLKIKTSLGKIKYEFRYDDTMTKCDGIPLCKNVITVLYRVS
jgi:hypothetical protein